MINTITSTDFILPFLCVFFLFFLSARLYSLRNMGLARLTSEFNVFFAFGKIAYSWYLILIVAYLIVSMINGNFLIPIGAVILGFILSIVIGKSLNLPPTTQIPFTRMTINCIMIVLAFIILLIHVFRI